MFKNVFNYYTVIAAIAAMTVVSCSDDDKTSPDKPVDPVVPENPTPDEPEKPSEGPRATYSQQYRPQIHFTPERNWMNDPNGMVYLDGVWHLFYQYNPYGNGWGNMSWGHTVSTDLIHWEEKPVALTKDALGDIFSGSAIIDYENTAGFGKGAMVCFYTSTEPRQQQSMAYSTNGGENFSKYGGNPVVPNDKTGEFSGDFRDPKVIWHEGSQQWIMSLARGYKHSIEFYGSKNLKNWEFLSSFSTSAARCNGGQWECPDLFKLGDKWVLIVSTNPGGPIVGSGTMYFVGDFDGKNFTADALDYPLWLDYGLDNYAGVTFSNTGDRKVFIGWMNNWSYAGDVPCDPWRSAMTLPRDLSLSYVDGKPYVACKVSDEINAIAGEWKEVNGNFDDAYAYHVQVPVSLDGEHTVSLKNKAGQVYDILLNGKARTITARRNDKSGKCDFNGQFSKPTVRAFVPGSHKELTLDIYIDQSSVEIVTSDGLVNITNLVFPSTIYNSVSVDGEDAGRVRTLETIWK